MNKPYEHFVVELRKQGIRPLHRRIKILEYLYQSQMHPTVDQIYVNLKKEIPNLSRTTIYNTLHMLTEAGLIKAINIEDNETRYDIVIETHGHFKCEKCGAIFDFKFNPDSLSAEELIGFKVVDKNVYFKGVCPKCLLNINSN
jgi:Fe2+ or Zn2+ uptake regulation protein